MQCTVHDLEIYDPVWDEGDKKVLSSIGVTLLEDNLVRPAFLHAQTCAH